MRRNIVLWGVLSFLIVVFAMFVYADPLGVTLDNPTSNQNLSGNILLNVTTDETNVTNVTWHFSNASGLAIFNVSNLTTDSATNITWVIYGFDSTTLNDGLYNISATAQNQTGEQNISVNATHVFIDNTNPTVTLNATVGFVYNLSNDSLFEAFTLNATVIDAGNFHFIQWNLSNSTDVLNATNLSVQLHRGNNFSISFNLTDDLAGIDLAGGYNITLVVNDTAGNNNFTEYVTIILDAENPNVTINFPGSIANVSGTIVLNGTVQDRHGVNSVFFNISNQSSGNDIAALIGTANVTGTPPFVYNATFDTTLLADGAYNLSILATDSAGRTNTTENISFAIDNTNPAAALNVSGDGRHNFSASTLPGRFGINSTITDAGNLNMIIINLTNKSGQINISNFTQQYGLDPNFNFTLNLTNLAGDNPENHAYNVTLFVNDSAGNINFSDYLEIVVDFVNPNVSINRPTSFENVTGSFVVNATVHDAGTLNTVVFNISNQSDGVVQSFTFNSDSALGLDFNFTLNSTGLADGGIYNLTISATDFSGNVNNSQNVTFGVDNSNPAVTLNATSGTVYNFSGGSTGSGGWPIVPSNFTLNATITDGNIQFIAFNLSNGSEVLNQTNLSLNTDGNDYNISFNLTHFNDTGVYNITVIVNSSSGTTNTTEHIQFAIDRLAPAVTGLGPTTLTVVAADVMLNATVTDFHTVDFVLFNLTLSTDGTFAQNQLLNATANNSNGFNATFNVSTVDPGLYNFTVVAFDAAGNRNTSERVQIRVIHLNYTVTNNTAYRQNFNVTESITNDSIDYVLFEVFNETDTVISLANQTNNTQTGYTALVNITNIEDSQNYTINKSVYTTDGTHVSKLLQFIKDTVAPTVSITCSDVTVGSTSTCSCTASDAYDSSPTTTLDDPGASVIGTKQATCDATDAAGNAALQASASYTVTGGGGGGGGGGAGGGSRSSVNDKTKGVWTSIFAGETADLSLQSGTTDATGLTKLSFGLTQTKSGVVLEVSSATASTLPTGTPTVKNLYKKYAQISHRNLGENNFASATIEFIVAKSWLVEKGITRADVRMNRLENGVWKEYIPREKSETPESVTFAVEVPGYSYFAIGVAKAATPTPVVENPTAPVPTVPGDAPTTPPDKPKATPPEAKSESGSVLFWIVLAIVLVVAVVYFIRRRK